MSRVDNLPPSARAIALLLSSTPAVQDAQPDARIYAEHAGRSEKIDMDDIVLAVQARVGWEYGGRVPKEYIQSLATQTNAKPLPPVEEVFGVRLPQDSSDVLTAINFDLIPNKPPPGVTLYDEEIEEVESSDEEEAPPAAPVHRQEEEEEEDGDEDMEPAVPLQRQVPHPQEPVYEDTPFPVSAIATPGDVHMFGTPNANAEAEAEEDDGLFSGGDDDDDSDAVAEEVANAVQEVRKLQEEEDYD